MADLTDGAPSGATREREPSRGHPALADYPIEIHPHLAEEAVLLAIEAAPIEERRRFRAERNPLYEISDPDAWEAAFRALHLRWLDRSGLPAPLRAALAEESTVPRGTARCLLLPALSARDEFADLLGDRSPLAPPPTLAIRLRPETLADPVRLAALLSRELLAIADLLDPDFAYSPEPLVTGSEAPLADLVRRRYQVLWQTTLDGRLAARGRLSEDGRQASRRRFLEAFPQLGPAAESAFERLFAGPRPTHPELAAFARNPGTS